MPETSIKEKNLEPLENIIPTYGGKVMVETFFSTNNPKFKRET